jgi:uncharacterized membrane protein
VQNWAISVGSLHILQSGALSLAFEGFGAGLVVMALLLLALGYALAVVVLAFVGRSVPEGPEWITYLIPVLCVIGMAIASYLTFVEARQVEAVCGPVGDCNAVQSSPYARLFGIVPVGLMGLVGYLAILVAWAIGQFGKGDLPQLASVAVLAFALFGVLFSIYLTYLELAIILAVCIWCLSSAVVMAIILMVASGRAATQLASAQGGEA